MEISFGKRLFLIILFSFIIMRILYIYFYQYLNLQYIHIHHGEPFLKQPKKPLSSSNALQNSPLSSSKSSRNNSTALRNRSPWNVSSLVLKKSSKLGMTGLSFNRTDGLSLNGTLSRKKGSRLSRSKSLYEEWENKLTAKELSWEDFVSLPRQPPRLKQNIPLFGMTHLRQCENIDVQRNSSFNISVSRRGCNDVSSDCFLFSSLTVLCWW
jgi:hypothetical protein